MINKVTRIIALLLIVCIMLCACGENPEHGKDDPIVPPVDPVEEGKDDPVTPPVNPTEEGKDSKEYVLPAKLKEYNAAKRVSVDIPEKKEYPTGAWSEIVSLFKEQNIECADGDNFAFTGSGFEKFEPRAHILNSSSKPGVLELTEDSGATKKINIWHDLSFYSLYDWAILEKDDPLMLEQISKCQIDADEPNKLVRAGYAFTDTNLSQGEIMLLMSAASKLYYAASGSSFAHPNSESILYLKVPVDEGYGIEDQKGDFATEAEIRELLEKYISKQLTDIVMNATFCKTADGKIYVYECDENDQLSPYEAAGSSNDRIVRINCPTDSLIEVVYTVSYWRVDEPEELLYYRLYHSIFEYTNGHWVLSVNQEPLSASAWDLMK